MNKINFVFAVHGHQPTGNFDHVFQMAYERCYQPFLDVMKKHPGVKFSLHYSGCLLEWIEQNHVGYFSTLRQLVDAGTCELLGGGMYEPILIMLSEADARGQLDLMSRYLQKSFGVKPSGIWLAERVWEQSLASLLADAEVKFTLLDDLHFKGMGLGDGQLNGYFTTEDRGKIMSLFPIREELRYAIPFRDPEWTIEYLRRMATPEGDRVAVYADDVEKFGLWPETFKHVYEQQWLERFLTLLDRNREWINVITFSEALKSVRPAGKIYLPHATYREMEEWAVLPHGRADFEAVQNCLKHAGQYDGLKHFVRGGSWRNFKVRYPEANLMYGRMMALSQAMGRAKEKHPNLDEARTELYRAQCNCAYWHGVFGGLYLPHLKNSVFQHLIQAEELFERSGKEAMPRVETLDIDLDGVEDMRLYNRALNIFITPSVGGHMVELDVREKGVNAMAVLARREEPYHRELRAAAPQPSAGGVQSIHHIRADGAKEWLDHLHVDRTPRHSWIDHFYRPGTTLDQIYRQQADDIGDFAMNPYAASVSRKENRASLQLQRDGVVHDGRHWPLKLSKQVVLKGDLLEFELGTTIKNTGSQTIETVYAAEFNWSGFSADIEQSYLHYGDGVPVGSLSAMKDLGVEKDLYLLSRWHKCQLAMTFSQKTDVWSHPVFTVSRSEKGFESIFQGACLMPRWLVKLEPGKEWKVVVTVKCSPL